MNERLRTLRDAWAALDPSLRGYLSINFLGLCGCTVLTAVGWLFDIQSSQLSRDFTVLAATMVLQVLLGVPLLLRYGATGLVVSLLVSSLFAVTGLTWVTPFLASMTVLLCLVPLMVAHPYLGARGRRVATWSVVAVMAATAVVAEARRYGDQPHLPTAMASLGLAVPVVALVIAQSVRLNYRLLARQSDELRRSRRDVVAVADAARRSLERDLHDGAQQRLIGISVRFAQLTSLLEAGDIEGARRLSAQLREDNLAAVSELRDLARGIYPPLLRDRGLVAALNAVALRLPIACQVDADDIPRADPATEAAVYFCVVESLQNAVKHSEAQQLVVRLAATESGLSFEVVDDGRGFDVPAQGRGPGSGLHGMTARIAAESGSVTVRSSPGRGTRVAGMVPAPKSESTATRV